MSLFLDILAALILLVFIEGDRVFFTWAAYRRQRPLVPVQAELVAAFILDISLVGFVIWRIFT